MGLSRVDVRALLDAFDASTWQEMVVTVGSDTIQVARLPGRVTAVVHRSPAPGPGEPGRSAPAGAAEQPAEQPAQTLVAAPSVGTFWRAPAPGAAPLVDVGQRVGPEDPVGIVEVMDRTRQVPAGFAGRVTAVLAADGQLVEYGQPLVALERDGGAVP